MKGAYMKRLMLIILSIVFILRLSSDESDDALKGGNDGRKIKFRGEINLDIQTKFGNQEGVIVNHTSPSSGKIKPRLKADVSYSIIFPVNLSRHSLFNDSNCELNFLFSLTPVTISGGGEICFSPLPFLSFTAGTTFGTGWNIPDLANGLARDNSGGYVDTEPKEMLIKDSFFGVVMQNWLSMKIKFDLAAFFKRNKNFNRWTHFVFAVKTEFLCTTLLNYSFYERPFVWQTSTLMNGWTFGSSFFLGYKIPVIIDNRLDEAEKKRFLGAFYHTNFSITLGMSAALKVELTHYNDSKMAEKGWGSDFTKTKFGPVMMFDMPCNLSATFGVDWENGQTYDQNNADSNDFKKMKYEDWYVKFNSIFISIGWEF
jgi:hypothetical protein